MELWDQRRFVLQAGQYLERFKERGENVYNFRCPFCNDSKKSKYLCRAYLYPKEDGQYYFKCQNCGRPNSLANFLKDFQPSLYQDYVMASIGPRGPKRTREEKKKEAPRDRPEYLRDLKRLSSLPPGHPAVQYIVNRKIPTIWLSRLYYAPDFAAWVNGILPGKLPPREEDRIVIPFIDKDGVMIGAQGRSLDPFIKDQLRYMSVAIDTTVPQVFGMDLVDEKKKKYIFEGPFDAMFIPNSIALSGASKSNKIRGVYVLDNQPRNAEIVKLYHKLIANGNEVFIWPTASDTKEDLNDLVKRGMIVSDIKKMIDDHTYSGLMAEFKFGKWKKI